jgi:hypothetical protein
MLDVYGMITELDADVVERVAEAMEVSAADPQRGRMVAAYLDDLDLANAPVSWRWGAEQEP